MLIGALADAVGLPTPTIRFYERKGLLPAPERGANGYRSYDESTLARLRYWTGVGVPMRRHFSTAEGFQSARHSPPTQVMPVVTGRLVRSPSPRQIGGGSR